MRRFSSDFIDRILFANDIVSLIQEDTALKGSGSRYMGLCPFPSHTEKTPSFSVSGEKQVYHCFGCQKSGNIFTYLKEQRGLAFREAVEYLAGQAQIPLPKEFTTDSNFQIYKTLKSVNKKASLLYHKNLLSLPSSHKAWDWLKQRGFSEETIKAFRLGYAPKGNQLLENLRDKERSHALSLGLLSQSKKDTSLYDTYRDRLIFPIVSTKEEIVGFGARVLDNTLPKYINSRDSKIFSKGRTLYGLNRSGKFLRNQSTALIVEGYTDFLALWQRGITNVVATLGTALTADHGSILKRYVRSVVVLFDGDDAGVKAAERSLLTLLSEGLEVKGITLPSRQDPDEFIREQGETALKALLDDSQDLFFQILRKNIKETKEKGHHSFYLVEKMAPFLKEIPNRELCSLYKNRVLDIFGGDRNIMEKALNKALREKLKTDRFTTKTEIPVKQKPSLKKIFSASAPSERLLFVLCIESKPLFKSFLERKGLALINGKELNELFLKLKKFFQENEKHFERFQSSLMNDFEDSPLVLKNYDPVLKIDAKEKEILFKDCLQTLERKNKKNEASEMVAAIKMNGEENFQQLEKVFQLTKQRLMR